ncbi:MAG: cardiolipin synthase [Polyangiales bacterium]
MGPTRDAYGQIRKMFGSKSGFETLVSGNRVTLLHDGEQAFPAMLDAIAAAEREVLLEMYWFASDDVGRRFADSLSARAAEGVRVRVIYDAVGSVQSDGRMFAKMRQAGCEVEQYNPIAPWRSRFRIGVINNRDHRKLLVVDRRIGFTGGVNLGDEWAPVHEGGGGWRDDTIRIEGPAVEQMRSIFMDGWHRTVEPDPAARPSLPPPSPREEGVGSRVRVLANHYFGDRRAIRRAYLHRITRAKRSVCITNSYFIPDARIRRVLRQAAERGVDVRVMIPGKSDSFPARYAARRLYGRLLRSGIKLYEWHRSVLHSKTAIVDGQWCTVGTYNLDYRSWRFNLEVVAAVEDSAVAGAMERRFHEDLAQAEAISYEHWKRRPLHIRVLDRFFYLFRKML